MARAFYYRNGAWVQYASAQAINPAAGSFTYVSENTGATVRPIGAPADFAELGIRNQLQLPGVRYFRRVGSAGPSLWAIVPGEELAPPFMAPPAQAVKPKILPAILSAGIVALVQSRAPRLPLPF
jgi:hypothetical protein